MKNKFKCFYCKKKFQPGEVCLYREYFTPSGREIQRAHVECAKKSHDPIDLSVGAPIEGDDNQ